MRNLAIWIALAATLGLSGPARAMDLSEAAARLVAIDSELTRCMKTRILATVIVVRKLRACIADRKPEEGALRKDLNSWISTLAGDNPDRDKAIAIRVDLTALRAFMNRLDEMLKKQPDHVGPDEIDALFGAACQTPSVTDRTKPLGTPQMKPWTITLCE